MKKTWLVVGLCAFGLFFVSLVLVAGCVVFVPGGGHFGFGNFSEKASRQDVQALEIAPGQTLRVKLPNGDVDVETCADGAGSMTADITAWGRTREEADQGLAASKVTIEKVAGGLSITFVRSEIEGKIEGGSMRISSDADFKIRVPAKVRLDLQTDSGDLEARGPFADTHMNSSYGDVRVRDIEGDLVAESSSGDIDVAGVKGKRVVAKTNYGEVHLARAEGTDVEASSSSGDLKAEDVRGERLSIKSSYGDVDIAKASGALEAATSSGDVRVSGFEGKVVAHSSYGDVKVDGVLSELSADSSSGAVDVRAQAGSKAAGSWKVSSSYGDVSLLVPADFACDLAAKTEYGDLDIGFAITVEAGGLKKSEGSVRGKMNGGGSSVSVTTSSGDVRVRPIK